VSLTLVLGPGKAGRALALAHRRTGDDVRLVGRRSGDWQAWAEGEGIEGRCLAASTDASNGGETVGDALGLRADEHPATLVLAVPDDGLAALVTLLDEASVHAGLVAHVSGLHGVEALAPLAAHGAATAALHPMLQFVDPDKDVVALATAQVTVDCSGPDRVAAHACVARWGATAVDLPHGIDRRRYHLGLAVASNHVTALFAMAEDLLRPAFGEAARTQVARMAGRAVAAAEAYGAEQALTGPVVRGDVRTIAAHLAALEPEERTRYAGMLEAVVALAERSGRLDAARAAELRALTREHA
jgi:predicted short-subunit dehydrogenase-like oxidoreductase (DUF2520 family)